MKMKIKFYDESHKERYEAICAKMGSVDCYRQATAYLLTLDNTVFHHINEVYNFDDNFPKHEALNQSWQTGTSTKTTRLIYNLWNSWVYDSDSDFQENKVSKYYAVDEIFCTSLAIYYFEAIKIRFEYCE